MRYLLLDRISELSPPERARGVKCVALSDDIFEHHFPGYPVLPGALIIEALAQLGGVLLEATQRQRGQHNLHALLVAIDRAKFRQMARPGDRLELLAETLHASADGGRVRGEARLTGGDKLCAEAELTFAFARVDNPQLLQRRREYLNLWLHGQTEDAHHRAAEGIAVVVSAPPVHIRGVGAVTPLGRSWPESFAALAAGRGAVGPVRRFDATGYPSTVAACVDFPLAAATADRRLALLAPAMAEAVGNAGLDWKTIAPERIGVFIGAESGRAPLPIVQRLCQAAGGGGTFDHPRFGQAAVAVARDQPAFSLLMSPAAVAAAIAAQYGAAGPVQTFSLACASSAAAIIEAVRALRRGRCDIALCGGVGADVDPLMLAGFGKLGALSARGESCPFDVRRDGFVVGEGAAALVLSGAAPGTDTCVTIAGIGRTLDAYHLTAPDPEGAGAERAMRSALADAGLTHCDCVQAHGTSTPLNDAVEALALRRVFGAALDAARVSSVKGALGHWVAGAGALGLLCAYEAVRSGTVLPTCGLIEPDPRCDLPHVRATAVQHRVDSALVNAFAFGGANCALVVRCA